MDMVERVARAIAVEHECDPDNPIPVRNHIADSEGISTITGGQTYPQWRIFEADARAAINAMREGVSKEMIWAAAQAIEDHKDSDYSSDADGNRYPYTYFTPGVELAVFQAMIDAALKPA